MANAALHDDGADEPRVFAREMVDIAASATRAHPYANRLGSGAPGTAMFADAAHFFALLHAERPSAPAAADRGGHEWLESFTDAFDRERSWLMRVAAAGVPRRFELGRHELLVRRQREAMLTLVGSDRAGCALGAVVALAADWPAVRQALAPEEPAREVDSGLADVLAAAAVTPAARRAIGFGVVQMLAVHRQLWDLLEAREAVSLP